MPTAFKHRRPLERIGWLFLSQYLRHLHSTASPRLWESECLTYGHFPSGCTEGYIHHPPITAPIHTPVRTKPNESGWSLSLEKPYWEAPLWFPGGLFCVKLPELGIIVLSNKQSKALLVEWLARMKQARQVWVQKPEFSLLPQMLSLLTLRPWSRVGPLEKTCCLKFVPRQF
jgi:hypothetical protein